MTHTIGRFEKRFFDKLVHAGDLERWYTSEELKPLLHLAASIICILLLLFFLLLLPPHHDHDHYPSRLLIVAVAMGFICGIVGNMEVKVGLLFVGSRGGYR